jgi:hypothetical protein
MTAQQFHEGQDVEVFDAEVPKTGPVGNWHPTWCKAKIVNDDCIARKDGLDCYLVQFRDGKRGVFSVAHIRAGEPRSPRASRPTAHEQAPSYRTAMHDAGRGKLLP